MQKNNEIDCIIKLNAYLKGSTSKLDILLYTALI